MVEAGEYSVQLSHVGVTSLSISDVFWSDNIDTLSGLKQTKTKIQIKI